MRLLISCFIFALITGCATQPAYKASSLHYEDISPYYQMYIPNSFTGEGKFTHGDTRGFTKRGEAETIQFFFEVGKGTPFVPKEFKQKEIPKTVDQYTKRKVVVDKKDHDMGYLYYAELSGTSLRNRDGIFLIYEEEKDRFIQIMNVNFAEQQLQSVLFLLGTIKPLH